MTKIPTAERPLSTQREVLERELFRSPSSPDAKAWLLAHGQGVTPPPVATAVLDARQRAFSAPAKTAKAKRDKAERQAFKAELRQDTDRLGRCAAEVVAVTLERDGRLRRGASLAMRCAGEAGGSGSLRHPPVRQGRDGSLPGPSPAASGPDRSGASRDPRRRVYVAHPIVSYGTTRERDCLRRPRTASFPAWTFYDPAERYSTDVGWLRAWPRVLSTLDALVVFGTRGRRCRGRLPPGDRRCFAGPVFPSPCSTTAAVPAPTPGAGARPGRRRHGGLQVASRASRSTSGSCSASTRDRHDRPSRRDRAHRPGVGELGREVRFGVVGRSFRGRRSGPCTLRWHWGFCGSGPTLSDLARSIPHGTHVERAGVIRQATEELISRGG